MHIVFAYIKFLLRSTNQHGVHSPFVYSLVTKCFYDRKKYPSYALLKEHRKSLLKDKKTIQITDFGAGSKVFKTDTRKVSKMAKNAGISPKRARLLNRLVRYLEVDRAVELGTSLGLGTAAIAAGNMVKITTIEGCPETAKIAGEKFKEFGFDNIQLKVGKFEEFLGEKRIQNSRFKIQDSKIASTDNRQPTTGNRQQAIHNSELLTQNFDLLFIDGHHQKEATLSYFEKLLPLIHNDSVMIFDDIHWSKGMEAAWEEIKANPKVTVSIDTFQWGLVFFRREQEKEHFVIRI
ncbi:O-methyltransferase [Salinimicrobium terrae]|uniref:O-methyltransferase n=1 Tax=Salinimicrobium terrae TaxID=470866 RepID=UPI0003F98D74|nr:class I SAM-dependent methyltransferase [Salinimicrobium terrae]